MDVSQDDHVNIGLESSQEELMMVPEVEPRIVLIKKPFDQHDHLSNPAY